MPALCARQALAEGGAAAEIERKYQKQNKNNKKKNKRKKYKQPEHPVLTVTAVQLSVQLQLSTSAMLVGTRHARRLRARRRKAEDAQQAATEYVAASVIQAHARRRAAATRVERRRARQELQRQSVVQLHSSMAATVAGARLVRGARARVEERYRKAQAQAAVEYVAASMIQAHTRRRGASKSFQAKKVAAIRVQAATRRRLARKKVAHMRTRRERLLRDSAYLEFMAASMLQAHARRRQATAAYQGKKRAAVTLQSAMRRVLARKKVQRTRAALQLRALVGSQARTVVQGARLVARMRARRAMSDDPEVRYVAAQIVQSHVRRRQGTALYQAKRAATVTVQSAMRRVLGRRRVERMRARRRLRATACVRASTSAVLLGQKHARRLRARQRKLRQSESEAAARKAALAAMASGIGAHIELSIECSNLPNMVRRGSSHLATPGVACRGRWRGEVQCGGKAWLPSW